MPISHHQVTTTTLHRAEREAGDPFKYATGVCMDAARKFGGVNCVCDNGGERGDESVASVAVKCTALQENETATKSMEETIKNGWVVEQIVCDSYSYNENDDDESNDHGIICIHEHFETVGNKSEYASCNVSVNGESCSTCQKMPKHCDVSNNNNNEPPGVPAEQPSKAPGFVIECDNVEPMYQQETLCFHHKRSELFLENRIPEPKEEKTAKDDDNDDGINYGTYTTLPFIAAVAVVVVVVLVAAAFCCWRRCRYQKLRNLDITKSVYAATPQDDNQEENVHTLDATDAAAVRNVPSGIFKTKEELEISFDNNMDDEIIDINHSLWIAMGDTPSKRVKAKVGNGFTKSQQQKQQPRGRQQRVQQLQTTRNNSKLAPKQTQKKKTQTPARINEDKTRGDSAGNTNYAFETDAEIDIHHSLWIAMGGHTAPTKRTGNNLQKVKEEPTLGNHVRASETTDNVLEGGVVDDSTVSSSYPSLEEEDIDINHSLWIALGDTATGSPDGENKMIV